MSDRRIQYKSEDKSFMMGFIKRVSLVKITLVFVMGMCSRTSMSQPMTGSAPDDTIQSLTDFSGSIGLTNNGFSIVPSFSLNSPAVLAQLSWRKNRFSFDPDIRLTPTARKGSMIFWLRYQAVENRRFSLRMGAHPSLLLQTRNIMEDGVPIEISTSRRFFAWELAPNLQLTNNWGIGMYYLQGNALQRDGPQTTHFVTLNTSITQIPVGKLRLSLFPAVYYLNLDGYSGQYFTASATLDHVKFPYRLQAIINQTLSSNLPGNEDFLWSIAVFYKFSTQFRKVK